ncbi:MAG TPA: hypothetical protein VMC78_01450 [Mycobacterium sp.]|nr:hypothetical protein [Mycobacterium sp.]
MDPLSGVVTFLFTDVEGSTRRWEADAEGMRVALAARNFYDSGQVAYIPKITTAITHLRDVLGDRAYESLARKGETMTAGAMVAYAYDQIDQARTELNATSK